MNIKTLLRRIEILEGVMPKDTRPSLFFVGRPGESAEEATARVMAERGKRREDFSKVIMILFASSPNSRTADVIPIHGGTA